MLNEIILVMKKEVSRDIDTLKYNSCINLSIIKYRLKRFFFKK